MKNMYIRKNIYLKIAPKSIFCFKMSLVNIIFITLCKYKISNIMKNIDFKIV